MSDAQQALFLIDQTTGGIAYNVAQAFRLQGSLDVDALRRAVEEVVRRHEVLRSRFVIDADEGGRVEVLAAGEANFETAPVSDVDTFVHSEVTRPFNLGAGRNFRVRLGCVGPDDHVLVMVTHHIVSDSVSKHVIVRELATLYSDFRAGRPSSLPEPILQYYDYTRWQAQSLADSTDLDWWRSNLKGAPEWSELPCDRPAPPMRATTARNTPTI